jgi:hypothetical protein
MHERNGHQFYHRPNGDGAYNSICTDCYLTVASTPRESELTQHEDAHTCNSAQLYQEPPYQAAQHAYRALVDFDRGRDERDDSAAA